MPTKAPIILLSLPTLDGVEAAIHAACPQAQVRVGPYDSNVTVQFDKALCRDADIMLSEFEPGNLKDFERLKWIQITSAGYSQLINIGLPERSIRASNGLGNFDIPIAEWNIMMMLAWRRNLWKMLENQRQSKWEYLGEFQQEVRGLTVGFYGYGGIARETPRSAKGMGWNVWVMTRDGKVKPRRDNFCVPGTGDPDGKLPDRVFSVSDKKSFFAGLDYLFITLPLTPASKGLIGEAELRMLKPSAVLINPARAAIVDEQAFLRCMREGWIRGASFDVHYQYPLPSEHPLWKMPNVILTPHISGSTLATHFIRRLLAIFTTNLKRFLAGEPLLNELSVAQLRGE